MPTQPQQLDQDAVNLAKAIRQRESGGKFDEKGASGEHGGYQFMPETWKAWSRQYLGRDVPLDKATPEEQNEVAYKRIKERKDAGLNVGQIASEWNSGDSEAYLKNHKGVNDKGVAFDTPTYAKEVAEIYHSLKGQPIQSNIAKENTNALGIKQAQASEGETNKPEKSLLRKGLEFAFPILEEKERTPLQTIGDIGLSALTLVPGAGLAGKGLQAAGLLAKGAKAASATSKAVKVGSEVAQASKAAVGAKPGVIKATATAAGVGYGADVASKLSKGETNAGEVLTPGLGTAVGGLLGGGGVALSGGKNYVAERFINSLIKPLRKDFSYGKNPGRAVSEMGIVGNNLEDLAQNISTARRNIGKSISEIGDSVPNIRINLEKVPQYSGSARKTVNGSVLQPIDEALIQAAKTNNAAMFSRLQQTKKALTEDLGMGFGEEGAPTIISKGIRNLKSVSYKGAQGFKEQIGDMTQWTGNPSDDKVINAALKKVWKNVSEAQKAALGKTSPALRRKLEKLNERYGDLTAAEIATKYREAIHGRQNLISLGDKILGGTGLITGLLTGGPVGAGLGTAVATGLSHLAGSTAVKSRAARFLANPTKAATPGLIKTGAIRAASEQN